MPAPISSNIAAYGQPPSPEQAEELFKQHFSNMAYSILFAKFADLAENIVTFKILEVKPDKGKGVGTFILLFNNRPIYIPVVMVDSRIKPLDIFYYKDLNIFLPLSNIWLDEISKMSLDELGEPADIPDDVPRNLSLRHLVLPPQTPTGRIGLANDTSPEALDYGARALYKEALNHNLKIHPKFLEFIGNAPKNVLDGVKLAFERYPHFLQKVASFYGTTALVGAFADGYKKASNIPKPKEKGQVTVLTKTASSQKLKQVFGENTKEAFSQILKNGFAVKDTRKGITKVAMKVENSAILNSPGPNSGFYKLYFVDAPADIYFVIPFPFEGGSSNYPVSYPGTSSERQDINYLVISKDGKVAWEDKNVMGVPIFDKDVVEKSRVSELIQNKGGDTPQTGDYGYFICRTSSGIQATTPIKIERITDIDGHKKIMERFGRTFVIDDDPSRKKMQSMLKGSLHFLPKESQWVCITNTPKQKPSERDGDDDPSCYGSSAYTALRKNSIIKDPKLIFRWLNVKMQESGAHPATVKKASINTWWVDDCKEMLPVDKALEKIANTYGISVDDASGLLLDAQKYGQSYSFILGSKELQFFKEALDKWAQPPMGGNSPPINMQGTAPPTNMQGTALMTSEMPMAPAPQSPMSPTDLAIAEVVDMLQQQTQLQMQQMQDQMAQQQQLMQQQTSNNQQLIGVLQHIQQRSAEINNATGGMIPAGAEASPAIAAQMLAPTPPPQPEPPPQPVMNMDSATPELIASQINPSLAEQAGDLQDAGIFDVATLSMLAAAPILHELVSTYIPNLEKSLDNLGRIMLTLWMQEEDVKKAIGDETFISLEEKLRTVFKGLGEVILEVNRNAIGTQTKAEQIRVMLGDQQ